MEKKSIFGLTIDQLTGWMLEHGQKKIPRPTSVGMVVPKKSEKLCRDDECQ